MSTLSGAAYDLGRHSGVCAATGEQLRTGEVIVNALVERFDQDTGQARMERLEYGDQAWPAAGPARPSGLIAFWRSVVPEPGAKSPHVIDASSVMELFEQLADAEHPSQVTLRYVLALMLIRKRVLTLVATEASEGGSGPGALGTLLVLPRKHEEGEAPASVEAPDMTQEALVQAMAQLNDVLGLEE